MGTMVSKVLRHVGEGLYGFRCPACKRAHLMNTDRSFEGSPCWDFDGNYEKPTFSPSLLCRKDGPNRCHSFIKNGIIEFLGDCQHELANKHVPIPNWDDHHRDSMKGTRVYPDETGVMPKLSVAGQYGRNKHSIVWLIVAPDESVCAIDSSHIPVLEFPDGSISVSGQIDTGQWEGFLKDGFFISI